MLFDPRNIRCYVLIASSWARKGPNGRESRIPLDPQRARIKTSLDVFIKIVGNRAPPSRTHDYIEYILPIPDVVRS